jgi:hypothetical protein
MGMIPPVGGARPLTEGSPPATSFNRFEPLFEGLASEEHPPANAYRWQYGMPGTLPWMMLERCAREHLTSMAASAKFNTFGIDGSLNPRAASDPLWPFSRAGTGREGEVDIYFLRFGFPAAAPGTGTG